MQLPLSPSLAVTLAVSPPHSPPQLPGLVGLRQQCESRRDELLVYTFNLGWQGGQKKWSLEVPGGTSLPLPPRVLRGMGKAQKDLSPVLLSFITLYI